MSQEINQKLDWTPNSELAALPLVTADDHRYGMRHFAVGVTIITAKDGDKRAGLTATAVCSVTADPPRLVVFVNKNVQASEVILSSGALCVNVLAGEQEEVAKVFAGACFAVVVLAILAGIGIIVGHGFGVTLQFGWPVFVAK